MASILIVEDDELMAALVRESLEELGYLVTGVAGSSESAIRSAATHCPDLVLMDIHIEGKTDGIETAEILRLRFGVPVVFLTGYADDRTLARAMKSDPCGYLVKPFDQAALRCAVELGLHRHAMETRLRQRERLASEERRQHDVQAGISERLESLGTLAAGVAHEINNPLTFLLLHGEMATRHVESLERGDPSDVEGLHGSIAAMREAAARIAHVVADLLSFSQPQSEQTRGVDVRQSVEWALRTLGGPARERAKLVTRLAAVPAVAADPGRLVQIVTHIVQNAIDSLPEGSPSLHAIEIATSGAADATEAVIEVRDTGRGMSDEDRLRVFDPFFTTKAVGQHAGMGLSATHGIVSALGGRIEIDSKLAHGTTVRVVLPALRLPVSVPPPAASRTSFPPPSASAAPAIRGRVLVIDDEPMITRLMTRMLEDEHSVTEAHGGDDALHRMEALGAFDIVLCDLMMPFVNGMDVYERCLARDAAQAARFVFMVGGAYTPRAKEFLATVTSPRLDKPIRGEQLRRFVREYLAQAGHLTNPAARS